MVQATSRSLRTKQHPAIAQLADRIEATWAEQLNLAPYAMPEDLGYIEGTLEGERLVIENCCHQTPEFRKLHLELAQVGAGLDILHCVMFPHGDRPLPMFGVDVVGGRGQLGMAIVDLSPVQGTLPAGYDAALSALAPLTFAEPRDLPDWGTIFSPHCLLVRLTGAAEEQQFVDRVIEYLTIHCQQAIATPASTDPDTCATILAGQRHYCSQQQQNDKTRRVLEKAFDEAWADRYMTTVLFDVV